MGPPLTTTGHHWPSLATAGSWPLATGYWLLAIRSCDHHVTIIMVGLSPLHVAITINLYYISRTSINISIRGNNRRMSRITMSSTIFNSSSRRRIISSDRNSLSSIIRRSSRCCTNSIRSPSSTPPPSVGKAFHTLGW